MESCLDCEDDLLIADQTMSTCSHTAFMWLHYMYLGTLPAEAKIAEFANCIDLDEVAHNEPPHLDLHCLPSWFEFSIWYSLIFTFFENLQKKFFLAVKGFRTERRY